MNSTSNSDDNSSEGAKGTVGLTLVIIVMFVACCYCIRRLFQNRQGRTTATTSSMNLDSALTIQVHQVQHDEYIRRLRFADRDERMSQFQRQQTPTPIPSPFETPNTSSTSLFEALPPERIHKQLLQEGFKSYPALLYSEVKQHKLDDSTTSCCSICLADYSDTDWLSLLPYCVHLFHRDCIDIWLQLNLSCPVCRTSPLPTPLAEVASLTTRRD